MTAVVTSFARTIQLEVSLDSDTTFHFEWISTASTLKDVVVKLMKERIPQDVKEVELHEFENFDFKILKKLVKRSRDRFRVTLESIPSTNSYKVNLFYSAPHNLLSIRYTHELVEFIRHSLDDLKVEILKTMVKIFTSSTDLIPSQVKEVIAVIPFLGHADVKKVLRKLLLLCNQSTDYLEFLTEAISHIKRNNSEFNWRQVKKTDPLPIHFLEIEDCLELLTLIHSHLSEADTTRGVYYLRALVVLQELTKNLENFSKSSESPLHKHWNKRIKKFIHAENLSARFLANYSIENSKLDENLKKINHAMLFLFAQDSKSYKQGPWKYLVQHASPPIDRPSSQTMERLWQELILIQSAYTINRRNFLQDFHQFVEDAHGEKKATATQFDTALKIGQNCYFVEGCIELGRSIIDLHSYDSVEAVTDAMNLLLKIRNDNQIPPDSTPCHFTVCKQLKHLQNHIDDRVRSILNYCTQSHNPPTVLAAKQSLSKLQNQTGPSESVSLGGIPKCQLFEQSLQSVAPYISGLREMKAQLESDSLALSSEGESVNLNNAINNFLKNQQNKVIFLFGTSEASNSLKIKTIALNYLRKFQSDEFIPLYTSLGDLANPQKKFTEEGLKKYNLFDFIHLLQQRKVVWLIDRFDAAFYGKTNFNFYNTNFLERWPKARFVITSVNRNLKSCFNPNLKVRVIGERDPVNVTELDVSLSEATTTAPI